MAGKLPAQSSNDTTPKNTNWVWAAYFSICILPSLFFLNWLKYLAELVRGNETYSHIPLIPLVSICLIYTERRTIFPGRAPGWKIPAAIVVAGAVLLAAVRLKINSWDLAEQTSLMVLGLVLLWTGAFGVFFGESAMRKAIFPLSFLAFAIPLPPQLFSEFIGFLQKRSADAVAVTFRIIGIPFARQGFDFALPGVTIEVAEECGGIRSTLALVMTAAIAGHLWLRSFPRTLLLCLSMIPIAIAKNALRITLLSWLAVYVNRSVLFGPLHRYGGIPLFGLGLAMMGLMVLLLQRLPSRIPAQGK